SGLAVAVLHEPATVETFGTGAAVPVGRADQLQRLGGGALRPARRCVDRAGDERESADKKDWPQSEHGIDNARTVARPLPRLRSQRRQGRWYWQTVARLLRWDDLFPDRNGLR